MIIILILVLDRHVLAVWFYTHHQVLFGVGFKAHENCVAA